MGEFLVKLQPDDLKACQMSLRAIENATLTLGLLKRGYQHVWNEFSQKYGLGDKKIEVDYATGLVMERSEPVEKLELKLVTEEVERG